MENSLIITGSKGVIGKVVSDFFSKSRRILELDLSLGHDLTDETFVKKWFAENHAAHLVNLFAINDQVVKGDRSKDKETLFNISLESFRNYLDVNLTALFSVCREYARNNPGGNIVNFSSLYGVVSPVPELYDRREKHIAYGVSKAGVIQMTRHLAVHLAPGIRVNCIVPGGVEADQDGDFKSRYGARTPLGRMMRPGELNGLLDFLCSEKSSYATGSVLVLDGGWTSL